jgi:hypothetical protein
LQLFGNALTLRRNFSLTMPNNPSWPPFNRQRHSSLLAALLFVAVAAGALPVRAQYVNWTNSQTPVTGTSPESIIVGDFSGDGISDIAVGQASSVGILVGNGNGTFKSVNNVTTPFTPQAIAGAAFVNGAPEGIITVSNNASPTNNAVLILSNGSGGETVQAPFSLPFGSASSVATGDFNGDGSQDFAVTFQNYNKVTIFLGNGNGTFGIPKTSATGNGPSLVVAGNFAGHGMRDLAIINSTDQTISILLSNGDGTFTAAPTITVGGLLGTSGPTGIAVGDFTGDGIQDLAVLVTGGSESGVAIFPGKGGGAFGTPTILPIVGSGAVPSGIAAADFTGSGALDVVVFNAASGNSITLFQNDGRGDFSQGPDATVGNTPWAMTTGNFNGGTSADLAVVNNSDDTVSILLTGAASVAPAFTLPASPSTVAITTGRSVAFNVIATGIPAPTYQWTLNGSTTIPGASGTTDRVLLITGATSADVGAYTCTATNSQGSVQTSATLSSVTAATLSGNLDRPTAMLTSTPGYLTNLSSRVTVGTGGSILIAGFAIAGSGSMDLLLRGVGPALIPAPFGVSGALTNTQLTLYDTVNPNDPLPIVTNSGWSNAFTLGSSTVNVAPQAATLALMNTLGAFTTNWAVGSPDSALEVTPPVGGYTAQISGVGGATGIALAEVYDADAYNPVTRLVNLSTRAQVGTGSNILIGGFVIGGNTAETLLIRAVGPTLAGAPYDVAGTIAQPVLTIYAGSTAVYTNTGWGGDVTINGVFGTVGAFALNTSSPDDALLITLPPASNYTAQISGVNNTTGIVLLEVYEVY